MFNTVCAAVVCDNMMLLAPNDITRYAAVVELNVPVVKSPPNVNVPVVKVYVPVAVNA